MKIKEMSINERPIEKMVLYGKETLSNSELIAILLKTGTTKLSSLQLAERVINQNADGLRNLANITLEELMDIDGIGQAKAATIVAAVELGKRISASEAIQRGKISCVEDVVDIFMERLRYLQKEMFEVLLLDTKGNIISSENISVGDLCSSVVHPRETFKSAIKRSSAAIIFVHNHPSGDPTPSNEDIAITKRLIEAGNILGISVLDHIIIGDGVFVSMKASDLI